MYAASPATARKKSTNNRRREKSAMPAGNSSRSASSSSTATSDEEIVIRCPGKPLPYGGSTNNRDPDSQSTTTTTTATTDRRRQRSGDRNRHRRSTSRCRALHQPSPVHQHPQQPNHYYHHQTYSLDRAYASHHAGWPPPPPSPWSASPPPWMYAAAVATGPNCYYPGPPHGPPCQPEVDERMQRLENDKDSLQMQVSILMDQIDAQTEKISDLERGLSERSYQLQRSEETLQKEMLSRSSAETRQLELLSDLSSLKLRYTALEKENLEMRGQLKRSEQDMITLVSQCYSLCGATLGPGLNRKEMLDSLQTMSQRHNSSIISGTPPRHPGVGIVETPRKALLSTNSISSLQSGQSHQMSDTPRPNNYLQSPKTPPANVFRKVDRDPYDSLPRQQTNSSSSGGGGGGSVNNNNAETEKQQDLPPGGQQSELDVMSESFHSVTSPNSPSLNSFSKQPRGSLKKIFDKLKRANSGATLEGDPSTPLSTGEDFRRGGMRSTAGPRLGWKNGSPAPSEPAMIRPLQESEQPFGKWSSDDVAAWLHDMGLHLYISEVQRWNCRGQQLLDAPANEIEKELCIKNSMHKKKLILALESKGRPQDPSSPMPVLPELLKSAGRLDHQWAVRWLDDIGLPQYKDAFLESRLDGRMLHLMTVDDLCNHLKVTNLLHLICIKRGIQVLRLNEFNPTCLQRRSVPEDPSHPTPAQVAVWTNHRVMEWLRAVDLSEYAPNMRGSGVHGGLLVLEPRFTAELLATLLSIPQGKTLLRRHLATHFNQLVGRDVVQAKREMETSSSFPPLTPVSKVKIIKKSQFTLKRRKGKPDEFDPEDWICPAFDSLDLDGDKTSSSPKVPPPKSTDL